MPQQRILKIAVPCPLYKTFDYLLPFFYDDTTVQAGMRVRVPFGRQKLVGIIIEEIQNSDVPPEKLKSIISVLDSTSLLSKEILKLLLWAARYYVHPLGEVFQTALPVYLRNNDDAAPLLTEFWRINNTSSMTQDNVLQI